MGPIELTALLVAAGTAILVVLVPLLKDKSGQIAKQLEQSSAAEKDAQAKVILKSLLWTALIGAIPSMLFVGQLRQLTAKGDGLFKFAVSIMLLPLLFLFLYFVFAVSIAIVSAKYRKK